MSLVIQVTVELIWLEEQTDLSECEMCEDMIYGKMYRLWVMPYANQINLRGQETDIVVCQSCVNVIKSE